MSKKILIEVTGGEPELGELLSLLAKIEILGNVGANRTIPVSVDGDGSARLKFNIQNSPTSFENFRKLVFKKFEKQLDSGDTTDIHSIGE